MCKELTIEDIIDSVACGAKKTEAEVTILMAMYNAKCYQCGAIIRVDLKPILSTEDSLKLDNQMDMHREVEEMKHEMFKGGDVV